MPKIRLTKRGIRITLTPKKETQPPQPKKKQPVMGGYSNPAPRKKMMDEAGDISIKKKKKGN